MRAVAAIRSLPSNDPACLIDLELPLPVPGEHDLLVRVAAVSVNPIDTKVRASLPAGGNPEPRVLGWDAAGVVEAVGPAVRRFRAGDAVIFAGALNRPGTNSEFTLVDERITGRKPRSFSFTEAAALPLTGLAAWEALFERLGLDPDGGDAGRSLLLIGGAGGVGSIAIQLARQAGLTVIATASRPESQAWVRELGADFVIDHNAALPPQLAELGLPQVDAIANLHDTAAYWDAMAEVIRPQGAITALVSCNQPVNLDQLKNKSVRFAWEFMFTRSLYGTPDLAEQGTILEAIATLADSGKLRSTLTSVLRPIDAANLRRAHAQLETGSTIGKLVVSNES
ncbi:zinc-binding alcohol dehydrogenase family protein [Synechococcus sp. 1G10]|uniref:zinc-binding alcohol dehydrogenase family protein n=1 Tax=Synechococcus sp. 1G10 TaxID=2025605 RepID=UPI000B988678|nr:zinc-binding alcohol dehydrogenase family protein [Synechococcus sp. 1G10]